MFNYLHLLIMFYLDGEVTPDNDFTQPTSDTRRAIVEASEYPLSIIMVGVGMLNKYVF